MKWMVASDIHGSAKYCRELLDAYEREKADRLLLLGDLLYHGPRNDLPDEYAPKMVIAMLNAKKNQILCVRGNCDAEVDQMVLEFPILADYCMLDLGTKLVYATHGHLTSAEQLPPLREGDLFLQGHTHVPMNEVKSGIRCMNPGSVSLPKQDSWRGYMILETNQADSFEKRQHKTAARIGGLPFCVYMRGEIVSHSSIRKIEYRINVSSLCPVPKNVLKFIKEK